MRLPKGSFNTVLGVVLLTAGMHFALASSYDLEASGKTEAAALGNLKMAALRQGVANTLGKDEIKKNARLLRNEIFLKVDKFTSVQGDVVYRVENNKIFAKGRVDVDDEAVAAIIRGLPLNEGKKDSNSETSDQKTAAQQDSQIKSDAAGENNTSVTASAESKEQPVSSEKDTALNVKQETESLSANAPSDKKESSASSSAEDSGVTDTASVKETQDSDVTDTASVQQSHPAAAENGSEKKEESVSEAVPERKVKPVNTTIEQDTEFINIVKDKTANEKKIAEALQRGANPNAVRYLSGKTEKECDPPLILYLNRAGKDAKLWIVKALVEAGADINYVSEHYSLADYILRKASPEIADYYFSLKPDISNIKIDPIFGYSCGLNKKEKVNLGVYLSDFINRKKKDFDAEAYLSVYRNITSLVPDINSNGGEQMMCLIRTTDFSAQRRYLEVLLDAGVSPEAKVNMVGIDPSPLLFSALQYNDYDLVKATLDHGADINAKANEKDEPRTPLMFYLDYFVQGRQPVRLSRDPFDLNIAKALADAGADLLYETQDGKHSVASDFLSIGVSEYEYYLSLNPDLSKFKRNMASEWLSVIHRDKELDRNKAFELFKKHIELGCAPDYVDYKTPLILKAYDIGGVQYLSYLIDKVTIKEDDEYNLAYELVHKAVENNDAEALKVLAQKKVNFNAADKSRGTPLLLGAIGDKVSAVTVEALLDGGADPNVSNDGKTPLTEAISRYDAQEKAAVIKTLLAHKADPNVKIGKNERTPLMLEASSSEASPEVIRMLADAGADVNAVDKEKADAVIYAIGNKSIPVIEALIEKGADIKKSLKTKAPMRIKRDGKVVTEEMTLKDYLKESYKQAEKEGKISDRNKEFYDFLKKYF